MALTKEATSNIFNEHGGSPKNTGSAEAQVALFTARIKDISEHLQSNKKDHASTRALLKLVGQRKKLLKYLAAKDINKYRQLIERLNLRK